MGAISGLTIVFLMGLAVFGVWAYDRERSGRGVHVVLTLWGVGILDTMFYPHRDSLLPPPPPPPPPPRPPPPPPPPPPRRPRPKLSACPGPHPGRVRCP